MSIQFYNKEFREYLPRGIDFPALALVKDRWNDYGHYILYNLILYTSSDESIDIGSVKILDRRTDSTVLPDIFPSLDPNFCSLGQSLEYYEKIKKNFPETFLDILNSLNDIAINDEKASAFQYEKGYADGLMRFGAAEKAFSDAKMLLYENKKTVNDELAFSYSVMVTGATSKHEVLFDFKLETELPFRINVLIGKNGTGKTQFLGSMVHSISGLKYPNSFQPYNPLFDRVIAISYSLFDDFPKPEETTVFSYRYIGLRTKEEEIISDLKLGEKLRRALKLILDEGRSETWFYAINRIIPLENLGLVNAEALNEDYINALSYENAKRLSSGQSITLFILTELIAHIKEGSLILFDEPETHLHPSAISQLINVLYEILNEYKSYAIISTHSPIIVQDIPSKYITIFERQGNSPIIRKLPIESFGENISTLTSKIFDTIEVKELYKIFLDNFINTPMENIERQFENGLSINAQLYLSALKNRNRNQ